MRQFFSRHALTLGAARPRPQKTAPDGKPTQSAHPARFSPDDKFSRVRAARMPLRGRRVLRALTTRRAATCQERVTCKKRFNLLPTQKPAVPM